MFTEEQILELYFKRDEHAVEMTSQMYGAKLTRFADSMVAHEDAVECVNDTYIAAWNKIPPQRPHKFLAWLYKVCRNIVCDRMENNIYAQVALVMLIGLLGKNAILIIEVANQCRKEGVCVMGAAIQGATSRLRPILMTSFAFISGLIPLTIASGAGALGNRSIGTAAAGGMLIGTFVGIFLIPGLYVIFESLATYFKKRKEKEQIKEDEYVY